MTIYVIRIPREWRSQVDSYTVCQWLGVFLRQPHGLAVDTPKEIDYRMALYLPRRAVRRLALYAGDTITGSLRRLIRTRIEGVIGS